MLISFRKKSHQNLIYEEKGFHIESDTSAVSRTIIIF